MSWSFSKAMLAGVATLKKLVEFLATKLADLFRDARYVESAAQLPYGPSVRPAGDTAKVQLIEVTDGVAFTVENPSNPREGVEITLEFTNSSGGSMGAVTLGSEFRLDSGGFTRPVAGSKAVYSFVRLPS